MDFRSQKQSETYVDSPIFAAVLKKTLQNEPLLNLTVLTHRCGNPLPFVLFFFAQESINGKMKKIYLLVVSVFILTTTFISFRMIEL